MADGGAPRNGGGAAARAGGGGPAPAPAGLLSSAAARLGIALSTFSAWWNKPPSFDLFDHSQRIRGLRYSNPRVQAIIASYDPRITPGLLPIAERRLTAGAQALKQRVTMVLRLAQYRRYYNAQAALGPSSAQFLESEQNLMKDIFLYLVAEAEKQAAEAVLQAALPGYVPANSQAVEEGLLGGEGAVDVLPWQVREALNAFIAMQPALAAQYGIAAGGGVRGSAEMPYLAATAGANSPEALRAALAGIRVHLVPGNAGYGISEAAGRIIEQRRQVIFGNVEAPPLSAEERAARGLGSGRGVRNAAAALLANRPAGGAAAAAAPGPAPMSNAEAVAALTGLAAELGDGEEGLEEGGGAAASASRGMGGASGGRNYGLPAELPPHFLAAARAASAAGGPGEELDDDEEDGAAAGRGGRPAGRAGGAAAGRDVVFSGRANLSGLAPPGMAAERASKRARGPMNAAAEAAAAAERNAELRLAQASAAAASLDAQQAALVAQGRPLFTLGFPQSSSKPGSKPKPAFKPSGGASGGGSKLFGGARRTRRHHKGTRSARKGTRSGRKGTRRHNKKSRAHRKSRRQH